MSNATSNLLDPKYENLPWIAHGQPDVYESGDLPEAEQKLPVTDDIVTSKEIENVSISTEKARQKFANCYVDASKADFSDPLFGSLKHGYTVDKPEYESLPAGISVSNETLMQRFQRLQTEVRELLDDASKLSEDAKPDPDQPVTAAQLTQLATSLQHQVTDVQLSKLLGDDPPVEFGDVNNAIKNRLWSEISAFNQQRSAPTESCDNENIVYEIYNVVDNSSIADTEKLSELDRRLSQMESMLGRPDVARLSALTADSFQHGLVDTAYRLAARSALLQPQHLDHIEAKLTGLQIKLQAITEKREAITDADTQNKIAELYQLVKKWNSVAENLPSVVERLSAMKELHDQAAGFSRALTLLEVSQTDMDKKLGEYSGILNKLEGGLAENLETIKTNVTVLEEKIKQK